MSTVKLALHKDLILKTPIREVRGGEGGTYYASCQKRLCKMKYSFED